MLAPRAWPALGSAQQVIGQNFDRAKLRCKGRLVSVGSLPISVAARQRAPLP